MSTRNMTSIGMTTEAWHRRGAPAYFLGTDAQFQKAGTAAECMAEAEAVIARCMNRVPGSTRADFVVCVHVFDGVEQD